MAKTRLLAKTVRRRRLTRCLGVLASLGLIAGLAAAWFSWPFVAANVYAIDLPQLADADLEPRLRTIANYGRPGLNVLVESLGSDRTALRDAADRVLSEKIDHARQAREPTFLDCVADALAEQTPEYDASSLELAASLAERIVVLSASGDATSSSRRLFQCHLVISAAAQESLRNQSNSTTRDLQLAGSPIENRQIPDADSFAQIPPPLAGGQLPIAVSGSGPHRLPDHLLADAKPLPPTPVHSATKPIAEPNHSADFATALDDQAIAKASTATLTSAEAVEPRVASAMHYQVSVTQPANARPVTSKNAERPQSLTRLLDLDAQGRSDDAATTAAAAETMKQLGINPAHLQLARAAVDADPKVRKELVEALPLLDSVDSSAWLVWLSHDPDAAVRRAALSLMATSSDPALKKRVREAADRDPDSRVRQQSIAALEADEPR
jgi:hypothetical protein